MTTIVMTVPKIAKTMSTTTHTGNPGKLNSPPQGGLTFNPASLSQQYFLKLEQMSCTVEM